jgi:hypothetical protein
MIIGERSSKRTDLRDAGAASIRARQPFSMNPKPLTEDDRREGVGHGRVPAGGMKVR